MGDKLREIRRLLIATVLNLLGENDGGGHCITASDWLTWQIADYIGQGSMSYT